MNFYNQYQREQVKQRGSVETVLSSWPIVKFYQARFASIGFLVAAIFSAVFQYRLWITIALLISGLFYAVAVVWLFNIYKKEVEGIFKNS